MANSLALRSYSHLYAPSKNISPASSVLLRYYYNHFLEIHQVIQNAKDEPPIFRTQSHSINITTLSNIHSKRPNHAKPTSMAIKTTSLVPRNNNNFHYTNTHYQNTTLLHRPSLTQLSLFSIPLKFKYLSLFSKNFSTAPNQPEPFADRMKRYQAKTKKVLNHYWLGTKLLGKNIKLTFNLVKQVLRGETLTRRERRLLVQTSADLFRLIPFIIILVVPFLEFSLPFLLRIFPNMLPSTYTWKSEHEEAQAKKVKANIELARFLQDTLAEFGTEVQKQNPVTREEFIKFVERIRSGEHIDNQEILRFSRVFQDELTLDRLNRVQLVSMYKYLSGGSLKSKASTWLSSDYIKTQLADKLKKLKEDDEMLQMEGVDELSMEELVDAAIARGFKVEGKSASTLREQLRQWLDLSLNKEVPPSLLVLSRSFLLNQDFTKAPAEPALSESLKYISESEIATDIPDSDSVDLIRDRLEELEKLQAKRLEKKKKTSHAAVAEDVDDIKEDIDELKKQHKLLSTTNLKETKTLSSRIDHMIEELESNLKKIEQQEHAANAANTKTTAAPTPTPTTNAASTPSSNPEKPNSDK
eukprot:TRINITY_DN13541_c0_g2_i1.p1 TRINITY_DN13541_c0_g2~~TRINITY_DN13541_c0_g2_i1.p1  ORF type:complete len:619 (-),score=141.05 TRINITY_DN13541_c0_g2_i1:145-1896(-)